MWGIMGFGGLFIDNYQLPPDATDIQVCVQGGGRHTLSDRSSVTAAFCTVHNLTAQQRA
jgi:hypothetical protein